MTIWPIRLLNGSLDEENHVTLTVHDVAFWKHLASKEPSSDDMTIWTFLIRLRGVLFGV